MLTTRIARLVWPQRSTRHPPDALLDLRPNAARWFEILVPKEDAGDAMEALARHGQVQFEWTGDSTATVDIGQLNACIARYRAIATELARYLPEPAFEKRCCRFPVEASAKAAVRRVERWRATSKNELSLLQSLGEEIKELEIWSLVLTALGESSMDLGSLARAGPALSGFCLLLPAEAPADLPDVEVHAEFHVGGRCALLGVAPAERIASLCEVDQARGVCCLPLPDWFRQDARTCLNLLPERRADLERRVAELERSLRFRAENEGVALAAGLLERIDWVRRHAQDMRCTAQHCWITGWTSEEEPQVLNEALRSVGVRSSVALVEPPRDVPLPSVTRHRGWLQAFEVFTKAVGVPSLGEVDPTAWVALLVPLLFGYMCGDVGHGLLIFAAGAALRSRTNLWPLLACAGISATAFGFAYGDVFGYPLMDPLWVHPLDAPLAVLLAPLGFGALVLTLGVILHTVGTCSREDAGSERVADAAQLLVYWGLLLLFVDPRLGWFAAVGVTLCFGAQLRQKRPPLALLSNFGKLLESTLQMLLNTLSFARVGAFALAHAALESAVVGLAATAGNLAVAILIAVIGNLVVVVVEGLVVSIQTTRLVLFEFFVRFFEGRGRAFEPASKPPAVAG